MRILVVAATSAEIAPFISGFEMISEAGMPNEEVREKSEVGSRKSELKKNKSEIENKSEIQTPKSEIFILITGVGMIATAFALGKHLAINQYYLIINLGIAGSFDRNIALGSVMEVTEDTIAELGAEDDQVFIPLSKLEFGEETFKASARLADYSLAGNVRQATAITVNTVHGNEASIQNVSKRLNPQLESMEGAAVFYACQQAGIPCMQIRAVSNYVEKRNRANWQIGLAIKNLNNFALELFSKLKAEGSKS